jgi:hypothetical protein
MASQISLPPEVLRRAKEAAAAEAPAPAADASGLDAAEEQATRADFFEAVEYVNTQAVKLSDDAQRKLFGLHCVATNGAPPPNDSPSFRTLYENMPESERAKDAAWRAAHEEHPQQLSAMRAYVDEVAREVPDFLLSAPEEDASDDQLAKVKNDLSACGINESNAPPPPPARDVFEAARAGAASLKAFGDFDVNEIDDYHLTPLIHAVDAEREDSARLLLDAGADLNQSDDDGSTPLHYAALLGSIPLATLLADRGADRSLKDGDGNTAADVARSEGYSEIAELLATP